MLSFSCSSGLISRSMKSSSSSRYSARSLGMSKSTAGTYASHIAVARAAKMGRMSEPGLFADGAVIRRVYSDAVCNLGAGSALLLQLAHPAIAQGVHEHSAYETRPLDRLFGTIRAMNSVVFGSHEEAAAVGD